MLALAVFPWAMRPGDRLRDIFTARRRNVWLLRVFSFAFGVIGSVTAFTHLPMAEAFALMFLQPAFVTIMSVLFLKERVKVSRWMAVAIGFAGVMIVLRPGYTPLSIGHVGALFAGFGGAVSVVSFRAAGRKEKRISLLGAGILGSICIPGLLMLPSFVWPNTQQWGLLASYGLLAALANMLLASSTTRAPAAYVGLIQYSQMLWAIILGYLVFLNGVDRLTLLGATLIIASGLLTLVRGKQVGTSVPHAAAGRGHHSVLAQLRGRSWTALRRQ